VDGKFGATELPLVKPLIEFSGVWSLRCTLVSEPVCQIVARSAERPVIKGVIPNKNQRHRSVPRVELIYVVPQSIGQAHARVLRIPPDQVIELGARVEI
jgi:hypothetical protein